jgi:hypothetical protein
MKTKLLLIGQIFYLTQNLFHVTQDDDKLVRMTSNVNLLTSQLELNQLPESDNEIIQRAIDMSKMICNLYLFTRYDET